jgi:hypothetical protein
MGFRAPHLPGLVQGFIDLLGLEAAEAIQVNHRVEQQLRRRECHDALYGDRTAEASEIVSSPALLRQIEFDAGLQGDIIVDT